MHPSVSGMGLGTVQHCTNLTPRSTCSPRPNHACESSRSPATPSIRRRASDADIKHSLMQDSCSVVLSPVPVRSRTDAPNLPHPLHPKPRTAIPPHPAIKKQRLRDQQSHTSSACKNSIVLFLIRYIPRPIPLRGRSGSGRLVTGADRTYNRTLVSGIIQVGRNDGGYVSMDVAVARN